ncbi:MAG: DNA polymerase I [Bdellovibrionota bacterium]
MVPPKRSLFCLIDASSFIFRAFYAVRPLSNKAGLPTNAVFGFANMILKVLENLQPTHIAVVYDTKHPSFRKEMYPEYKANRSAMPEDLVPQMPYVKKFVEALGLPGFEQPGFEADDIIGTLAERAAHMSKEADVCIVSSDKDLMQLVNGHIYLYDTMKEVKYTPAEVKEKLGVPPAQVPDYLGIVGDSSDNIPGVKGIGPKGAVALLEQFGSVEEIYNRIHEVKKEGQRNQLIESKDSALLSKELATVKRDMDIKTDWHSLRCEPKPGDAFFALLQELEFGGLEKRMRAWTMEGGKTLEPAHAGAPVIVTPHTVSSSDLVAAARKEYKVLRTMKELEAALESVAGAPFLAVDTETTSLAIHDAKLVGFSFCGDSAHAYYAPVGHESGDQLPLDKALKLFGSFLKGRKLVGQNIKYDINIFRGNGIEIDDSQVFFDTMIASYILAPEERHNMDALSAKYLNHKTITYGELCGEGKSQISFAQVPIEKAGEYSAEDAHVTFLLMTVLGAALKDSPGLEKVFQEIDLPLIPVLAKMEWEGVAIDVEHLKKVSEEFALQLAALEKRAHELAGSDFNLASPKQLGKVLFEDLKLPVVKKTKTGFSTDVEVLQKLRHQHELPEVILEYRELSKLKGTYVDVLPLLRNAHTGRVHTNYNQTIAATGRLSSTDPNLQNIPIRTASGRLVRQAFVPRNGNLLLGADYSQVELRILASMSGDKLLCQAFSEGQDVHALTASQIFSVPLKEVDSDQRRKAKAINFGLLYGKGPFTLGEELGITRTEATDIIARYFARYPTIRAFLDGLKESAKKTGFAETLFGRRRYIEGIQSQNKMLLAAAERMAVNAPIQGTAADLIKIAMIRLQRALEAEKLGARLILQVHDELVLDVPEKEAATVRALVIEHMENAGLGKIHVPLTVEVGMAKNWLEV